MTNILELISDFQAGVVTGVSELKLRNENIQEKNKAIRIPPLKKESALKEKLLFLKEIAIPWNPMTGVEDETYNRDQKFRPQLSQHTVMLLCKGMADANPKAKETFLRKSGVKEWDTSDLEKVTATDKEVFKKFVVPRLFTLSVAKVNIPAFTGNVWGKDYLMEVKRDDRGEVIGEVPLILKVNKLMADMAYEEVAEYEKQIKDGKISPTEKEKKEHKAEIWDKVVVSSEFPQNYGICVGVRLNAQSEIANPSEIVETDIKDMLGNFRLVRRNKEIKESLEKYSNGTYSRIDIYDDFWEFDMNCPKAEDPKEIGQGTRYEKPTVPLNEVEGCEAYINSIRNTIDSEDMDWEKIFMSSVYVSRFNSSLEESFLQCVRKVIDLHSPYMTDKVVNSNSDIITLIFGEEGETRVGEAVLACGIAGNLNEEDSAAANRQHTLSIAELAENNTGELDTNSVGGENEINIEVDKDQPF